MRLLGLSMMLTAAVAVAFAQPADHFAVLRDISLKGIPGVEGTWSIGDAEVRAVEAHLADVSHLGAENWKASVHIVHPENYFRQYVPVLQHGRKYVYVNAFCEGAPPIPRDRLVFVFDGGTCYWQAFFDPATNRFVHLTVNGRA